jgi:hypothetical protein
MLVQGEAALIFEPAVAFLTQRLLRPPVDDLLFRFNKNFEDVPFSPRDLRARLPRTGTKKAERI